ncbi:MAG: hypothetical protein RSC12_06630 [Alistipes sp.]
MKRFGHILLTTFILLLGTAVYVLASSPQEAKTLRKEQQRTVKAQKKQTQQEVRAYESLRDAAVIEFAKTHQPSSIITPFTHSFTVNDIRCVGDKQTGIVMLNFSITPLMSTGFRIFIGGSLNGTEAAIKGVSYRSELYGRIYDIRSVCPTTIAITVSGVKPNTPKFDWFNISMGLRLNIFNLITLRDVPIFWTDSNQTIRNYVKNKATQETPRN